MRFFDRFSRGELRLARIEAFSDGVFAIVVTLLVLELKVPALHEHDSVRELAHALVELCPKFLSWLISFVIVCKFWLNHHHLLGLARHANYAMVWLNSFFLMFQSFIPFPTAMMGEHATNPLAVTLFGVVMAVNTLLFLALQAYITKHLLKPELAAGQDPHALRKAFVGPLSYLAGAAAAWISIPLAFLLYLLTPHLLHRAAGVAGPIADLVTSEHGYTGYSGTDGRDEPGRYMQRGRPRQEIAMSPAKPSPATARRERVVEIGTALPEATCENPAGQHLTFRVRKKVFLYYLDNHHGDGRIALNAKVAPGDQEILLDMDPERFFLPAYVGHRGWIGVRIDLAEVDWGEVEELIRESYRQVAPKTLAARVA